MNLSKLTLSISLVLVVLCSAACQRTSVEGNSALKNVSLFHYFSFSGSFSGTMDKLAADFNQANSGNTLTATPLDHESFKSSIRDDLRIGNAADVYSYWAGERVQSIVDKLSPVDDVLSPEEMKKLFGDSVVKSACTYNGRAYLVPLTQHYVGFFYNKKIFAEHGLTPPKDWNEFLMLGEKLKSRGIVPLSLGAKAKWPAQFWFDYLLLRTAPLEYRQKLLAGRASFSDPEVVRVFSMWRDLIKHGFFNKHPNDVEFDSGAAMMVRRGEAAMTLMGTWLIGYYNSPEIGWHEDGDYGFFPFPTIDPNIPRVALGPIDGLVVPLQAKNLSGAKAVVKYFAGSHAQEEMSRGSGAMAPNLAVSDSAYSPLKLAIRNEISQSSAWAFNYDLATPYDRAEVGLNLFSEFLEFPDQYKIILDKAEARMNHRVSR